MAECIGVMIAVIALALTVFLERRRISSEFDQFKRDLANKNLSRQTPSYDSHRQAPSYYETPSSSNDAGSVVLAIFKALCAVGVGGFSFVWVAVMALSGYLHGAVPESYNYFLLATLVAGFVYGIIDLRKRPWWFIFLFMILSGFGGLVIWVFLET